MSTMPKIEINIVVDENGSCNFNIPAIPPLVFMEIWTTVMRAYVENATKPREQAGRILVPKGGPGVVGLA